MTSSPLTDMGKIRQDPAAHPRQWLASILGEGMPATHQVPVVPTEWILDFDYPKNPIPLNGPHGNPHAHAKKVKKVRLMAGWKAKAAHVPALQRCSVQLTWYVLTRTHRDVENLAYTLKSMCDGLVDVGVAPDDTPDLMEKPMPRIIRVDPMKHTQAWMELVVTRWAGPDLETTDTAEQPRNPAQL